MIRQDVHRPCSPGAWATNLDVVITLAPRENHDNRCIDPPCDFNRAYTGCSQTIHKRANVIFSERAGPKQRLASRHAYYPLVLTASIRRQNLRTSLLTASGTLKEVTAEATAKNVRNIESCSRDQNLPVSIMRRQDQDPLLIGDRLSERALVHHLK